MASASEVRTLVLESEFVLRERRRNTSDEAERESLKQAIDEVNLLLDQIDLAALAGHAALLNGLAATLEGAVKALRERPFDQFLGQLQGLFDRIGTAQGTEERDVRAMRPAVAATTEAPASEAAAPAPATVAPAARTSAATTTPAAPPPPPPAPPPPAGGDAGRLAAMFASCKIRDERRGEIDRFYVQPLLAGRRAYEAVGAALGIPWWYVGIVHGLEGSFSFETHLHNGDPLTDRTKREPAGRPPTGTPPFSWVDSARDALTLERLDGLADWSLGAALDRLEQFNGLGYRNLGIPSPYLWSFSQHYIKGKFVRDREFDPEAVSRQCGGAVLLRRLVELGLVNIDRRSGEVSGEAGLAAASVAEAMPLEQVPGFAARTAKAELAFPGVTGQGQGGGRNRAAWRIQEWCTLNGSATSLDGDFGSGTAEAVRVFQGKRGIPATGTVDERSWGELTAPMRRVLARMEPAAGETLNDAVLRVARQHLAQHPVELIIGGESNSGPWVRLYMNGDQGENQLWCAGFVSFIVGQACAVLGMGMPFRRQVGVDALVADAKATSRFIAESQLASGMARRTKLRPGMIFVRRRAANDWSHTGIVTQIGDDSFRSIEGNTNEGGSDNGFEVCERSRSYDAKDFIALV